LVRIRDQHDEDSWSQFVEIYAPLVYGFLRTHGLQDADAADLTQDVLGKVALAVKSFDYNPQRGSFRRWLFTIVTNRLRNFWRDGARQARGTGDTQTCEMLAQQPQQEDELADKWDRACQEQLFQYAADRVRGLFQERTWRAFWKTAVEGQAAKEVAEELGMSTPAVLMAKGRVISKIKEQVRLAEGE
jgi:RNA polymerase sigma-70 factor (ECF subfamily)